MSEPTVVPYSVPALPDGAGSPREAVLNDIKKQNEQQTNVNNTFRGGRRISKRSSIKRSSKRVKRRQSSKSVKRGGKRSSSKRRQSSKRSSSKRRQSRKRSNNKRIVLYGGDSTEVPVPQFGNNSGPNGPNESSANFNKLLLESKQGAVHDKEI
jgi:hypothetical protein